jgi:hypothetical protein
MLATIIVILAIIGVAIYFRTSAKAEVRDTTPLNPPVVIHHDPAFPNPLPESTPGHGPKEVVLEDKTEHVKIAKRPYNKKKAPKKMDAKKAQ